MKTSNVDVPARVPPVMLRRFRDRVELLQQKADAALEVLAASLREQADLAARRQSAAAAMDAVRAALSTAVPAAQAAAAAEADWRARVEGVRAALGEASARLLGDVGAEVPLVLLPVRLETRFEYPPGAAQAAALRVRVYPDDIHVDAHEPGLTDEEHAWGLQFRKTFDGAGDEPSRVAAFRQLARRYGPRRAAWIATALAPGAPAPAARTATWTQAPRTRLLPDRWVALAFCAGRAAGVAFGKTIADTLAVGPSPQPATPPAAPDGIPATDAGMRWMVDFDAAVDAGMALRLPLTAQTAAAGIDRLLVFGVRGSLDASLSAAGLEAALAAHRYTDGLALLPLDTATNDTAGAPAGGAEPDADRVYELELRPPAAAGPMPAAADRLDRHWLAWALGLTAESLATVEHAKNDEVRAARSVLAALAAAGDSTLLRAIGAGSSGAAPAEACASGPLPPFRVGSQPYAVLPAVAHRQIVEAWPPQDVRRGRYERLAGEGRARAAAAAAFASGAEIAQLLDQGGSGGAYLLKSIAPDGSRSTRALDLAEMVARPGPWSALPAGTDRNRLRDAVDAVTTRIDVWLTALATQRLATLRTAKPDGVRIGAYGYVEDLRPAARLQAAPPVAGLPGPVSVSPANHGYLQAPSLSHAAAAAVLRSGYFAQNAAPEAAIDLSSLRVQQAQGLLGGVRQGQSLAALLGYRFERGLQENGLAAYIARFRTLAALKRDDAIGMALDLVRAKEADLAVARDLDAQWQQAVAAEKDAAAQVKLAGDLVNAYKATLATVAAVQSSLDQAREAQKAADARVVAHEQQRPRSGTRQSGTSVVIDTLSDPADYADWSAAHAGLVQAANARRADVAGWSARREAICPQEESAARNLLIAQADLAAATGVANAAAAATLAARKRADAKPIDGPGGAQQALASARAALAAAVTASWTHALSSVSVAQVVDGLELHRRWRAARPESAAPDWSARTIPFGDAGLGFPALSSPDGIALRATFLRLADQVDAVGDLLVAESMFQLVRGNPIRAGGALDVLGPQAGMPPAQFEVVRTPRSGAAVTHRVLALMPADVPAQAGWPVPADAIRARVEPALESYAAALLPPAANVVCAVEYRSADGKTVLSRGQVRAAALDLSALEFAAAAYASAGLAAGDASNELGERVSETARAMPTAPPGALVRLVPDATLGLGGQDLALAPVVELAAAVHHLIASGRPADGRDVQANAPGIDVADLGARLQKAQVETQTLGADLAAARTAALASGTAAAAETLRIALRRATHWRVAGAFPTAGADLASSIAAWAAQARSAAAELDDRLRRFAALPPVGAAAGAGQRAAEQVRALLGGDAWILPRIDLATAGTWLSSVGNSLALQGSDRLAVGTFLQRAAYVREGADRLQRVVTYRRALGAPDALFVGQVPWTAGDRWVGLPPAPGTELLRGRLSTVVHRPLDPGPTPRAVKALVLDDWVEVIPALQETSGVAFHFDQPGAAAPQVALLAVPPEGATRWDLDLVQRTVVQTVELAKTRAAPADGRTELTWFEDDLPRGAAPSGGGPWPWVYGSPGPLSGRRVHRSALAAGVHQHFFDTAQERMLVGAGETLFVYVYLDPAQLPTEVMLQWRAGDSWDHRAFWGTDKTGWGTADTSSRRSMAPFLPRAGSWVRLEVPAASVDLEGKEVEGMAFTLCDGSATWGRAGRLGDPGAANPWTAQRGDRIWIRDRPPPGVALGIGQESWGWVSHDPAPWDGPNGDNASQTRFSHRSPAAAGMHRHSFAGGREPWSVGAGDVLFAWVLVDAAGAAPREVMLEWNENGSWEHRAFWGEDLVGLGVAGTASRRSVSATLPERGRWVRLEARAEDVGLVGKVVAGLSFVLFDGAASWGPAGVSTPALAGELILA